MGLSVQESHLGFPIGMLLATFELKVALILPTKYQVNWKFCSGDEVQYRSSRWPPWLSPWISYGMILASFDLQVAPILPTKL